MASYTLKAQSVVMLRQILGLPGWAKDIQAIYDGGRILSRVVPDVKDVAKVEPISFEMEGPDRDICKTAFNHAISKEAIPPGDWTLDICETLEFVSKPKTAEPAKTP